MARIMVVDDSLFMRRMVKSILKELGHEVVAEASNGNEAIQAISKCDVDVVLLDITMPEMDGISALKGIKEIKEDVKTIMVSAMGQQYFIKEALSLGADDFIVKPFQKDRVQEALARLLRT